VQKKNDLSKPVFLNSAIERVPIHRGLVILGDEFQNYTLQSLKPVSKSFKVTQKD
jgi:hypothetical protein